MRLSEIRLPGIRSQAKGAILSLLSPAFLACVFDTARVDDGALANITVEKSLAGVERTLLDSAEVFAVVPNGKGDSLQGHFLLTVRRLVDSQFVIVTTSSQGGVDSVDTVRFHRRDTVIQADTLAPVNMEAEMVADTVSTMSILTDTTVFLEPDSGLAFEHTHRTRTTVTRTSTGLAVVDGEGRVVRHFEQSTDVADSISLDSLRFHSLDSVLTGRLDTLVEERLLEETRFRRALEDLLIRRLEKTRISRKVTLYHFHYISSKWEQDAEGEWMEAADTLPGRFASPESVERDTVVYMDTVALSAEMVIATVSDYRTGSYSAVTLDGRVIENMAAPIHSDAVVRYFGGENIYIINRFKRDNVQILDRRTLKTVGQFALPALSNPHDLLSDGERLYAVLFHRNSIRIHDAASGAFRDSIDIGAHADTGDGLAEAAAGLLHEGKLYVALGRLDRNGGWTPLPTVLLRIDLAGRDIDTLALPFANPNNLFLEEEGLLAVAAHGAYGEMDGGLIRVDPEGFVIVDTVLTEETLGGDLDGALWADGVYIVKNSSFSAGRAMSYDPQARTLREIASTAAFGLSDMTYDSLGKTLYLGDRVAGLRLFAGPGFEEKEGSGISLGLPPTSLAVVR